MRHLLLSGELHRTHPYLAPLVLYGHEGINALQGVNHDEIQQDVYNNGLGKSIAAQARSRQDVERLANQLMPKAVLAPGAAPGSIPWPHPKTTRP